MPTQDCAPAYCAPYSTRRIGSPKGVVRWRVPSERQAANDDFRSNILESPGCFVADIKLGGIIQGAA